MPFRVGLNKDEFKIHRIIIHKTTELANHYVSIRGFMITTFLVHEKYSLVYKR